MNRNPTGRIGPSGTLVGMMLMATVWLSPTVAAAATYRVSVSATFTDMIGASVFGVVAGDLPYTVTSTFTVDTTNASFIPAGTDALQGNVGALRQFDWYGIPLNDISNFAVHFGTATFTTADLMLQTENIDAFVGPDSSFDAPLWISPSSGRLYFVAFGADGAFVYSGPELAVVEDQAAHVTDFESGGADGYFTIQTTITPVPIPGTAWLILGPVLGMGVHGRRMRKALRQ